MYFVVSANMQSHYKMNAKLWLLLKHHEYDAKSFFLLVGTFLPTRDY